MKESSLPYNLAATWALIVIIVLSLFSSVSPKFNAYAGNVIEDEEIVGQVSGTIKFKSRVGFEEAINAKFQGDKSSMSVKIDKAKFSDKSSKGSIKFS